MPSSLNAPLAFPIGGAAPITPSERDLFGRDIFFSGVIPLTPRKDYQVVQGIENLRRAIWRRLATNPGEYKLRPNYGAGVRTFLKKPITASRRDELRTRIIEQLSAERRIQRVLEVTIEERVVSGVQVLWIFIRVEALGREVRFEPFLFSRKD